MTVEEIDLLIGSIDRSTKEGQRNRAILETLYSCGLRVSELCNLKLSELYFEEGFIKVEGKGSKQRLVPISPRAIKEIRLYFTDRNLMKIKPGFEDFVFISNFGKNISLHHGFPYHQGTGSPDRSEKKSVLTHSAILLQHICWKEVPTCVPYSACWDMKVSGQQKFIHI